MLLMLYKYALFEQGTAKNSFFFADFTKSYRPNNFEALVRPERRGKIKNTLQ